MAGRSSRGDGARRAVRVAVVGCGAVACAVHLPLLGRMPGVRVVALVEPDEERRVFGQRLAPRAAAAPDLDAVLERTDVDAVIISSPTACHAAHALAALQTGRHVYLEKPLASTLADGRAVHAAWRRAGVVGMMGFNYRFNPLVRRLRACLAAGAVGEVVAVRTTFTTALDAVPAWKTRRESGGGVLLDLGAHHIDLVRMLLGAEVTGVRASLRSRHAEDDCALLDLQLATGVPVQSFFAFGTSEADRLEVWGERGALRVDRSASLDVEHLAPRRGRAARVAETVRAIAGWRRIPFVLEKLRSPLHEPSYRAALEHFAAAVRGDVIAEPDLTDGLASLAVIDAAERAARTGAAVAVTPIENPEEAAWSRA